MATNTSNTVEDYSRNPQKGLLIYSDVKFHPYALNRVYLGYNLDKTKSSMSTGMESSTLPAKNNLIECRSNGMLYPIIDDPFKMGMVSAADLLGGIFGYGITRCDALTFTTTYCNRMSKGIRETVMAQLRAGFEETARRVDVIPKFEFSIHHRALFLGGYASTVCLPHEHIESTNARRGDVIVLTKPLGCEFTCELHYLMHHNADWTTHRNYITAEEMEAAYKQALESMTRLNTTAARLMHQYNAHAATAVNEYGLYHCASELAKKQAAHVDFFIHTIPLIKGISKLANAYECAELREGNWSEMSGGLLICMPEFKAVQFCAQIEMEDGCPAWIVGDVVPGSRHATVFENATVVEVEYNS